MNRAGILDLQSEAMPKRNIRELYVFGKDPQYIIMEAVSMVKGWERAFVRMPYRRNVMNDWLVNAKANLDESFLGEWVLFADPDTAMLTIRCKHLADATFIKMLLTDGS